MHRQRLQPFLPLRFRPILLHRPRLARRLKHHLMLSRVIPGPEEMPSVIPDSIMNTGKNRLSAPSP
jgi:hypothetical protein